jgi:hypothetical protein
MNREFTRQELFDLVWAEPVSRLASKLGVSGVAIGKACRRADIPVPGRGYWARLQYGNAPPRPELPRSKARLADTVEFSPLPADRRMVPVPPDVQEQVRNQASAAPITVASTLAKAHPIVRGWLKAAPKQPSRTERRRLRILSTLFKEFEQRGHAIVPESDRQRNLGVTVGEDVVEFRLTERHKQLRIRLDPVKRRYSWEPEWRTELQPTGELVFSIDSWVKGFRKQWSDTKRKRLEEQINDVISGLIVAAAVLRRERLEREERLREWRAEEEKRRELEEARRRREKELQTLLQEVDSWQRANRIRDYVAAVRTALESDKPQAEHAQIERWATSAINLANEIDPLKSRFATAEPTDRGDPIGTMKPV